MVRGSREVLAALDDAVEEAAPKLSDALLPAQERATEAVTAAESVGPKWPDLLLAAEAAKEKVDALCEEADRIAAQHTFTPLTAGDPGWPSFTDYDDLLAQTLPALAASSAALSVAQDAEAAAQDARTEAFRAQTEALSRATQVGQALVQHASEARAAVGEMRLGVQERALFAGQTAEQEESAAQYIDTAGLFEEGTSELLMLTLEYVDLHEGARSLDAAVKSKPRMAEIGKGLVRVRTLLVESPLPVSDKAALFLLPPHHDYFVVGKKQVKVDRFGSPTALGKAFDSVADRMLLSTRKLGQFHVGVYNPDDGSWSFPDGEGEVDPGGKIRAVLQETAPGPCLGIQLVYKN
jgi:hypothetical protein